MDHKTLTELRAMREVAKSKVVVGSKYYHYKDENKLYIVTGLSILEASDEVAVKYTMLDSPDIEFVRALELWLENVEWNGQTVPRFTKVS